MGVRARRLSSSHRNTILRPSFPPIHFSIAAAAVVLEVIAIRLSRFWHFARSGIRMVFRTGLEDTLARDVEVLEIDRHGKKRSLRFRFRTGGRS